MTRGSKRITLETDDGGMLDLVCAGADAWLRIEPPPDGAHRVDSVNFRGRRLRALHAFAKRVAAATRPTQRKP